MEEALRQSEARYRMLVEQIPAVTYTASLDPAGTTLYVSPQTQTILGFGQADYDLDPDLWRKRLHPEDRERVLEELALCHATHEPFVSEYRMIARDDRMVWFRDEARVVPDETGVPLLLQGVMVDITDQKRTSEALRESEELAGIVLGNISDAVFITDDSGAFTYVSPDSQSIFGLSPRDVSDLGNIDRLLGPDLFNPEVLRQSGSCRILNGKSWTRKGKNMCCLSMSNRSTSREGPSCTPAAIFPCATEMENALRKAHDELESRVKLRTAELAAANQELLAEIQTRKRAEEAQRNAMDKLKFFAYSVMHDLKNPAIAVHGLTNLLKKRCRDAMDEQSMLFCDQIMKAAEHVAALVERINTFIATKESPLTIEPVNTREIFQTLMEEFSSKLSCRRIVWIHPEAGPEIQVDRIALLRALRNYVDNALKYGGEQLSEIRIGYEESETFHIFSVSDDGAGVTMKDSERFSRCFNALHLPGVSKGPVSGWPLPARLPNSMEARSGCTRGPIREPCSTSPSPRPRPTKRTPQDKVRAGTE